MSKLYEQLEWDYKNSDKQSKKKIFQNEDIHGTWKIFHEIIINFIHECIPSKYIYPVMTNSLLD